MRKCRVGRRAEGEQDRVIKEYEGADREHKGQIGNKKEQQRSIYSEGATKDQGGAGRGCEGARTELSRKTSVSGEHSII